MSSETNNITGQNFNTQDVQGQSQDLPKSASVYLEPEKETKIVTVCACISFLSNSCYSLLAPFYPLQVQEKGIDTYYVGYIMGIQSAFYIVASQFTPWFMQKYGKTRGIVMGTIIVIIYQIGLGSLYYESDKYKFVYLSFFYQSIGGFGAGMNTTAITAVMASLNPKNRERNLGIIEATVGLGILFGPVIGAVLYSIGGYPTPFFTLAFIYFLTYPFIANVLMNKQLDFIHVNIEKQTDVRTYEFFKNKRFVLGVGAQVLVFFSVSYITPIMAIQLKNYGFDTIYIGFSFSVPGVIYAATSPLIFLVTARMRKRGVIFLGFCSFAISFYMIGGTQWIGFKEGPFFIMLGFVIMGLGAGLITIPVLPELLESIEVDNRFKKRIQKEEINYKISGLFVALQGIGESSGPVVSSILADKFGFSSTMEIMGTIISVYLLIYFFFNGAILMFYNPFDRPSVLVELQHQNHDPNSAINRRPSKQNVV